MSPRGDRKLTSADHLQLQTLTPTPFPHKCFTFSTPFLHYFPTTNLMCECTTKTTLSMNNKRRPKGKAKKPKFLSLRHQFPPTQPPAATTHSRQLNLFPLHPENDREIQDQAENVALFFSAADGGASTLTGLLDNSTAAESISSHADNNSSRVEYSSMEERAALVRNALRSRDRDSSEEKWVCYSEVVKEEEVTSSAVPAMGRVSLKLDYEEIMNAWSNKGPLYIDANSSQIVPDINSDFLPHDPSNINGVMWGCNVGLWTVPEMVGDDTTKTDEEIKGMGSREASVLRYKEKRRNRLFSKKIRYQVRKLNAESRPRLKGRFVKRN